MLFSFSHIYCDPRINEVYTREASRNSIYENANGRSEQPLIELIAEYSFRYSFNFAICRLKSNDRNGKTRERIPSERRHYRRRRIYLEGIQIYTKRFHSVQPFLAPSTIQQPWHGMKLHLLPFYSLPLQTNHSASAESRTVEHCRLDLPCKR